MRWLLLVKGAHGRLLFPAIVAPAVLLVAGWWRLAGGRAPEGKPLEPGADARAAAAAARDATRAMPPVARPRSAAADRLSVAVAAVMAALAAYALLGVIRPAFAYPERIAEADVPASATRVGATFDGRLRLVAYEVPERAVAGGAMPVRLYWQVLAPIERDVFVGLRVDQHAQAVAANGQPWAVERAGEAALAYPGGGMLPFDAVAPGDAVLVDRRVLSLPPLATTPAGRAAWGEDVSRDAARAAPADGLSLLARLYIHLWEPPEGPAWTITDSPDAEALVGRHDVVAYLALDALNPPRLAAGPSIARFGDVAELAWPDGDVEELGWPIVDVAPGGDDGRGAPPMVRVAAPRTRASDAMSTTIPVVWRIARATPGVAVHQLVHLVDEQGTVVASFDGPPAFHGHYPSTAWRSGELLPGRVVFDVPPRAQPGDLYRLLVGLYRLDDGYPRLPATDPAGRPLPDDVVTLAEVLVTDGGIP